MTEFLAKTITLALMTLAGLGAAGTAAAAEHDALLLAQLVASDTARNDGDDEALKMTAIEGLIAAPPERALPLLRKVLEGNHSAAVKKRALFVLGQTAAPEAQSLLLQIAARDGEPLRHDAIRALGIGGTAASLQALVPVYRDGDEATRESVLAALLIAHAPDTLLEIARLADDDEAFAAVATTLGAMGATDALRELLDDGGNTAGLIQAYAIAGDLAGLQRVAAQTDDRERRLRAISSMGMIDGSEASAALVDAYRRASDEQTRQAALEGLLIKNDDASVLALFRASNDSGERRALLRTLVHMNSALVLDVIDTTLDGERR